MQLCQHQTHKGLLVKNVNPFSHPSVKGSMLQTVRPEWWKWRTTFGASWAHEEHINILELRALMAVLKWRAKKSSFINSRGLYLLDSQVALGALQKGRSPSKKLARVIERVNAMCLAASHKAIYAYVRTDLNPADKPSRARL